MYLWTFQKISTYQQGMTDYGYQPDFSKSDYIQENPGLKQLYDNLLLAWESYNGHIRPGLIFSFMAGENGEFFPIPSYEGFINLMAKNYMSVKSLLNHFKTQDYYLILLDVEPNYPLIPININDFQFLMPPFSIFPPYETRDIARLYANIFNNRYQDPKLPSNIVQVVYPYLYKDEIKQAYYADKVIEIIEQLSKINK